VTGAAGDSGERRWPELDGYGGGRLLAFSLSLSSNVGAE